MRRRLLNWLACPQCHDTLALKDTGDQKVDVEEGWLHCRKCDQSFPIVWGIPRFVSSEGYTSSFGRQWNRYARLQLDSNTGTTFSRERFYSITEWSSKELSGKRVLDVGCGAGRFSEVVSQDGAEVVAVDLSSAVDACRHNLRAFPK